MRQSRRLLTEAFLMTPPTHPAGSFQLQSSRFKDNTSIPPLPYSRASRRPIPPTQSKTSSRSDFRFRLPDQRKNASTVFLTAVRCSGDAPKTTIRSSTSHTPLATSP